MILPTVQSDKADIVLVNIKNVQAVALADGDAVVWDTATADGVRVTQPATATLSLFVGIVVGAIAAGAFGVAQAYGYKSAALVTNSTNQAIAAGNILVPVDAADHLAYSAASDGKTGFVFAGEAFATAATPGAASKKVFIRAL